MAFMRPEVTTKQDWAGVETTAGFWWVPFSVLSKSEVESVKRREFGPLLKYTEGGRVIDNLSSVKKGYGVRLSAPGYLDSTEWEVYGSAKEAQRRATELVEEGEGDHATKKRSPAQLDRDIAEALGHKPNQRGSRASSSSRQHHSTMSDDEKIRAVIARFPPTFGLRGFPGDVFRLSPTSSYVSGGRVVLYTQRKDGNQWLDFSKGSEPELRREVTS